MADIKQPKIRTPLWPWGAPAQVHERLIEPGQLPKLKAPRKGDPRDPPLASHALLEFLGPAHSSEEMRLPMPALPSTRGGDIHGFVDLPFLHAAMVRSGEEATQMVERQLMTLKASKERLERLKALLHQEQRMRKLVGHVWEEKEEIRKKREEEQAKEGY